MTCVCANAALKTCTADKDCGTASEVCADAKEVNSALAAKKYCFSKAVVKADKDDGVCIGVHHLRTAQLHQNDLVFENDAFGKVLCDQKGSCATPGHMVLYGGAPMMMKRYCSLVVDGCVSKVMKVNSPKYARGFTVDSLSEGLVFTAFAARWETNAEERALATAIRVGL